MTMNVCPRCKKEHEHVRKIKVYNFRLDRYQHGYACADCAPQLEDRYEQETIEDAST